MTISPEIRNQSTSRPSNTTFEHYPKDTHSQYKGICSTIFIAALFVTARTWKQPRCPSTEECIKKMWYIYTMEYYSAAKDDDILKFAGKWVELEREKHPE